jgi:hypothetical protein
MMRVAHNTRCVSVGHGVRLFRLPGVDVVIVRWNIFVYVHRDFSGCAHD